MNAAVQRAGAAPVLLAELRHADAIIKAMLNAMTDKQKAAVSEELDAAGVSGEGMTRHHERRTVIESALASSQPRTVDVGAIRQHASDVGAHAARLEILMLEIFDKLDEIGPKAQGARAAADVVECFTTCAVRNVELIREATADITALTQEGGAA